MGSEEDSDHPSPKIEEGTHSPSQPPQQTIEATQKDPKNDNGNKRKSSPSFIGETLKEIKKTTVSLETELPIHTTTAITITIATILTLILGWYTVGWLTAFGLISSSIGCYLIWIFQSEQQPTPEEKTQYIIYYGTAILFLLTGIQYIIQTW